MDNVETSALRTMMEVCENPDVRQGIQCALNFIEVSGYYNLTDWEAMWCQNINSTSQNENP